MKVKFLSVLAALAMVFTFTLAAQAQYAVTDDVIFLKIGYVPNYTVTFDGATEDFEFKGFAAQGEYNLNMGFFWLGIGLDYQYLVEKDDDIAQFISPMVTAKFVTGGGLYLGAGLSGRYMIAFSDEQDDGFDYEPDKEMDLWAHAVLGYFAPIAEGVYFNVEGRFGVNLTNNQWESGDFGSTPLKLETKSAYDITIYVGIGFRALSTGL